jgi:hypothetical protein
MQSEIAHVWWHRARRKREPQQRLLATDRNVLPMPLPSNGRARPGECSVRIPRSRSLLKLWLLKGHCFLLRGNFVVSRLKSMILDTCQRCAITATHSIRKQNASQHRKNNVLFGTCCNSGLSNSLPWIHRQKKSRCYSQIKIPFPKSSAPIFDNTTTLLCLPP